MGAKDKKMKKNKKNKAKPDDDDVDDGGTNGNLITDARFASMHSDPRFSKLRKKDTMVQIDSRFKHALTDKNFATSKAPVDKRGKPKKNSDDARNPLQPHYTLEDDEKERNLGENLLKNDEESESGDEKAKLKDESEKSSSSEVEVDSDDSSSTSTSTSSSTDSDEEDGDYEKEEQEQEEEKIPEIDKETHRLAVVNMDWSEVKAVDLYVMLCSFLPKGGHIVSVAVYPSEFGLKRMEEEAVHGPVQLFNGEKNKNDDEESEEDDDDDEIDTEKLRAYELSRLRYYFAVVECDSIATADYLYKTCDGLEFERSSLKLDLRFIPDSLEFKHQPRDVAKSAPADYEGLDFHTRALQQSKIQLTWDDDEPQRAKALKRKFNTEQLAELELQEFLASDESESIVSEDDDQIKNGSAKRRKNRDMYLSLIHSHDDSSENDEEDQNMVVTFNTGLEDLSKRILEKKDRKSETVWEAYLRKRREKKKAGKKRTKDSSEDDGSDTDEEPAEEPDDFFIEEPSEKRSKPAQGKNARKKKQNEEASQEAEASRAELELLLADDNGAPDTNMKGYNLKRKKMKGKRDKEILDEGKLPTINYDDPRFSALFTSPLFALDPTDPQFKRSAAYVRQMAHKQQSEVENKGMNQQSELPSVGFMPNKTEDHHQETNADSSTLKKEKHELTSLVKSIKMKSKQKPRHDKVPEERMNTKKSKLANR